MNAHTIIDRYALTVSLVTFTIAFALVLLGSILSLEVLMDVASVNLATAMASVVIYLVNEY